MLHIAEPSFYEEISRRLSDCDAILNEGIDGKITSSITSSYLQLTKNPKFGLVSQNSMSLDHVRSRMKNVDIGEAQFATAWSKLPILERFIIPVISRVFGFYLRHFGRRSDLARHMTMDLRETREELLGESPFEVETLILDTRDEILLNAIDQQLAEIGTGQQCIGILYGAAHMRAVAWHLIKKHDFMLSNGDWVTVFDL